ncbi:hypothetical protein [Paraburkholderia domus]|uniref:hypothetical protein n=1 Tax=Paraburkholderia domus TaxID=2793075 RepID=UPI00191151D5|nr:hypothetical protein [Paraburkholderia domus]MBK5064844.1 hypothetical protein [Burkholderia sp. R-70199]CAE6967524.1 hypothetical protein R70199_07856 [Paraburkholderia domus]
MKVVFYQAGDFEASRAAEAWCDARGIAVGALQQGAPRGLLVGYYQIAKWRNLNDAERRALEGKMTGNMRHGPVTINLLGGAEDYPLLTPEQFEHFAGTEKS